MTLALHGACTETFGERHARKTPKGDVMDEGREGGEVTVNPAILGPNRRPANITQWTIHDPHGNVIQTTDVVMAKLFIGSRSEH